MKRLPFSVVVMGILGLVLGLLLIGRAHAQLPTQIQPNGLGGYNVYQQGQLPTQVLPDGLGGYNVYSHPIAQAPEYVAPPAYYPPPMPAPYLPRGAEPFNGQSAGQMMYGQ